MLRVVGRRFGPVLRTEPHDSLAQALQWQDDLEAHGDDATFEPHAAGRTRSRRFQRDESRAPAVPPHSVQH